MADKFKILMSLDNAVFEGDNVGEQVAGILADLASRISEQNRKYLAGNGCRMHIRDVNGNNIGFAYFEIDDGEDSN
jgi:hypothetical protein